MPRPIHIIYIGALRHTQGITHIRIHTRSPIHTAQSMWHVDASTYTNTSYFAIKQDLTLSFSLDDCAKLVGALEETDMKIILVQFALRVLGLNTSGNRHCRAVRLQRPREAIDSDAAVRHCIFAVSLYRIGQVQSQQPQKVNLVG